MFDEMLREVGEYEASMWGAYLISFEVLDDDLYNPTVRFDAIEHGERFYFNLKMKDVAKSYYELHPKRA